MRSADTDAALLRAIGSPTAPASPTLADIAHFIRTHDWSKVFEPKPCALRVDDVKQAFTLWLDMDAPGLSQGDIDLMRAYDEIERP